MESGLAENADAELRARKCQGCVRVRDVEMSALVGQDRQFHDSIGLERGKRRRVADQVALSRERTPVQGGMIGEGRVADGAAFQNRLHAPGIELELIELERLTRVVLEDDL